MANKLYEETDIQNIANAIRNKNRTQKTYKVSEMSSAVDEISVSSIIDVKTNKIKFGYSEFSSLPNIFDFSNVTDFSYMFYKCGDFATIPLIDTSRGTKFSYMFYKCRDITTIPLIDTSKVQFFDNMFVDCYELTTVPQLNTSEGIYFTDMFLGCPSLSNESLNNILAMCINATSYTFTKTLSTLGLSSTYYTSSTIQSLSNYSDFVSAGWSIGY